jgi:putative copper resistance protein D
MHATYLIMVWLHILAAVTWIGGMFFLVLVVVPWLRSSDRVDAATFLRDTGRRFRTVGWCCFAILIVTGTFNLWIRGVRVSDFGNLVWLRSPFGSAVALKLAVFALVLVLSTAHDFVLGPRATQHLRDPRSALAQRYRRRASILGRANAVLALLLVALAVVIVRGWP